MNHYLIALHLENKPCVIVGGGKVATRKIEALLESGAIVTVISLEVNDSLLGCATKSKFTWIRDNYSSERLKGLDPFLVITCTNNDAVNRQITEDAHAIGAIVNNISAPNQSDFHNMATIQKGNIQVGISSGASSPTLTSYLKTEIKHLIDDAIETLSYWLGNLRPIVSDSIASQADRQALYRKIVTSDVLTLLRIGQVDKARQSFDTIVEEHLS